MKKKPEQGKPRDGIYVNKEGLYKCAFEIKNGHMTRCVAVASKRDFERECAMARKQGWKLGWKLAHVQPHAWSCAVAWLIWKWPNEYVDIGSCDFIPR
jgi:hypothetical protein